jgi:hypothetical protein
LVHHSDRGVQYDQTQRTGGVGDFYDNALAETVIACSRPMSSIGACLGGRLTCRIPHAGMVDWFNRWLLERIGNIPPAEAKANYYAILEEPKMAA